MNVDDKHINSGEPAIKAITSYSQLSKLGAEKLSESFYMRDFLYSEIANWHQIRNYPDYPDIAIETGKRLCTELLEPLQDTFGRLVILSGYRSPTVNDFGNKHKLNCASNEENNGNHIWDYPDKKGRRGATACIAVPWFVKRKEAGEPWTAMAWWVHDNLPYSNLEFFPALGAFNIRWCETQERRIDSYAEPRGCLTRTGMDNHEGDHSHAYQGFPRILTRGLA